MIDSGNPTETSKPATIVNEELNRGPRWLEVGFWLLAIILGFAHTWADRHYLINADAMSYLDIAEAYLRGDWHSAVNSYWNPLYSWLIAIALWLVKPSSYWKFSVLHLVNFAVYLFALACFAFLVRGLVRLNRNLAEKFLARGLTILPGWAIVALGYPLFIWSTLYLIDVQVESPDLLVASFMYLACAILLRIRLEPSRWVFYPVLGLTLGLGFLAKSVMLPMTLVLIGAGLFATNNVRRTLPRIALTVVVFVVLVGPFVVAMSRSKGRLTFGESGRLNYLWSINRVPFLHWQGDPSGFGMPTHPSRQIFDKPPVFEFGHPVGGTYPVWYDPTYWYEGSASRILLRQQLKVVGRAAQSYYELFQSGVQMGLMVGFLSLYLMGQRRRFLPQDLTALWILIIPALAGMGLYLLVNVQGRYVAPFIVLLWLALFSAIRLHVTSESPRLIKAITIALVSVITFTTVASSSSEVALTARSFIAGEDRSKHEQWQVAEGLQAIGVAPGDQVAVIGFPIRSFWAHLAELRIIAELPTADAGVFWEANPTLKDEVIQAFARTGAKVIVAETPPAGVDLNGWQKIGATDYYYFLLRP